MIGYDEKNDIRLKQNPLIILTDCFAQNVGCKYAKSVKTDTRKKFPEVIRTDSRKSENGLDCVTPVKKRKRYNGYDTQESEGKLLEDPLNGLLTPATSKTSSCEESESDSEPCKKRIMSEKSTEDELEVESIVGYYRHPKTHTMWYWVKWKNYDSKDNTWERIHNLTNCNQILKEYFEYKNPTARDISKMDDEVKRSLSKKDTILKGNINRPRILAFPKYGSLDITRIFTKHFKAYRKKLAFEYKCILRCLIGMQNHRDAEMFERAEHYKIALQLCDKREKQLKQLKRQQDNINKLEKCPVEVINNCDFEVLPKFEYITEVRPGKGVIIPTEPVVCCECPEGCGPDSKCCGVLNESQFVYTLDRKLDKSRNHANYPIYECNSKCKCSDDCPNRVVQLGRFIKLAIFKTEKCGWGVKTLEKIDKGAFVCEYVGEMISDEESNARDVNYCPKNLAYMFNLDFTPNGDEAPFVVDATHCGNLSRYLNHSCDPNVEVRVVWINCLDPDKPRLAFFAKRPINKGEELSFQYTSHEQLDMDVISNIRCFCGKRNCRKWIWGV